MCEVLWRRNQQKRFKHCGKVTPSKKPAKIETSFGIWTAQICNFFNFLATFFCYWRMLTVILITCCALWSRISNRQKMIAFWHESVPLEFRWQILMILLSDYSKIFFFQRFDIKSCWRMWFWISVQDVGGQRSERKKWKECFENVRAVVYVVNLVA